MFYAKLAAQAVLILVMISSIAMLQLPPAGAAFVGLAAVAWAIYLLASLIKRLMQPRRAT